MAPELVAHNRTKIRVLFALQRAVAQADIRAEVFTDGLTVPIDDHTAYEPDAMVRLGEPLPANVMKVPDPAIVVEVLSPSSVHMDRSAKLIGYFKLPSVKHYLVIDPETRNVTHHRRSADSAISSVDVATGMLDFDSLGITIEVTALTG
jgi:Uma2 family endonuclease